MSGAPAPSRAPGHRDFAIASLIAIVACDLLTPNGEVSILLLTSLAMLPAALTHLALTFPVPTALVLSYPRAVWVAYIVCAVPAAVGARSVARGPEGALVLTTIALGLAAIGGAVLVARLIPSALQTLPSAASQAARVALLGLVVAVVGLGLRGVTPAAQAAVAAFPLSLCAASAWLRRSERMRARGSELERGPVGVTLEQIAPGMAHAMRKPLAIVCEQLRLLSRGGPGQPAPQHLLESVELLEQVQRLVEGVLDLARGQGAPRTRRLNLASVVEQAVSDLRARFPAAQIEASSGGGFLMADEVSLRCLLLNLMENALEVPDSPDWVGVRAEHEGGWVRIEVEDRSGGLPEAVQARLFEPFVTTKQGGIGLGLATVREVTRAHGGSVEAASTPDGTRFVVRLPALPR